MTYDKGHQALYQGYYVPDVMEQVSKMMNSMQIGSAQIRDLAVKNAHIQSLETDKLVAGEVLISPDLLDEEFTSGIQTTFQVLSGKIEANILMIDEAVGTLNSRITQEVDHITSELLALDTSFGNFRSTIEQRATDIESNVTYLNNNVAGLEGDVLAANTRITQNANAISSKVSQTDYTGQTIVSMINQTASSVSIAASKINFVGQVFGSSSATFIGSLNTDQDINVGNNIYMNNSVGQYDKGIYFTRNTYISGNNLVTYLVNGIVRVHADTIDLGNSGAVITARGDIRLQNYPAVIQSRSNALYLKFSDDIYIRIGTSGIYANVNGSEIRLA